MKSHNYSFVNNNNYTNFYIGLNTSIKLLLSMSVLPNGKKKEKLSNPRKVCIKTCNV